MKIASSIAVLAALCAISFPAAANCVFLGDQGAQEYSVTQTWEIEHASDKNPTGCLAKITAGKDESLVYTPYGFICKMPKDEKIMLSLLQSCCDTGRQGDYACGIAPKSSLFSKSSLPEDTQTSTTAVPAKLDKRVIPELIAKLEAGNISGISNVGDKLVEYAREPTFTADLAPFKERLQAAHDKAANSFQKENIAKVLLVLAPAEGGKEDPVLLISRLQNVMGSYSDEHILAIRALGKHPEIADKSIPLLLDLAGRIQSDPLPIIDTLVELGPVVGPYLPLAYRKLHIDKLTEAQDIEKAKRDFQAAVAKDNPAGKEPPASQVDIARFNAMVAAKYKQLEDDSVRSRFLLPLWRKVVCAGRATMGDAKMNDSEKAAIESITCL